MTLSFSAAAKAELCRDIPHKRCCCLAEGPWAQDHGPHSAPTTGMRHHLLCLWGQPASHLWEPLPCAGGSKVAASFWAP